MKLVIATRNRHKLEEIRAIFNFASGDIGSALDFPEIPDTVENGGTLEANAVKKATEMCMATGIPALADDSGLEVEALNGAPGVYSARWAGENCSYDDNNTKLLRELAGKENRCARFRTVLALVRLGAPPQTVEGSVRGVIIHKRRGEHGFGYDPLFVPDGYTQTFAELPPEIKNRISHRACALAAAVNAWGEFLGK
ncbi:MAG: RdgB/HAM1 family non-canonical purine NTP pyrophosphatase [Kiritimatiellales bacterium]